MANETKNSKEIAKENEAIRLTIQIGMVASCLVVISGNYSILTPGFQLIIKLLALLLGLISMAYIMLTGRLFEFKNKKDSVFRQWFYDSSISFYWYIFSMIAYLLFSDLITQLFGINFIYVYIATILIATVAIPLIFIIRNLLSNTKK